MPKYTWEKMQNDPQELRKLIETIEQIDGKSSDESDKRLENMLTQLRSLQEKPNQKNANQIFADNMEKLGDRISFLKHSLQRKYDSIKGIPGFEQLEENLDLPEPGTGAFKAEELRSLIYDKNGGDLSTIATADVHFFSQFAALHDEVKDKKDWRKHKISSIFSSTDGSAEGPASDIMEEMLKHGGAQTLTEMDNDEKVQMLTNTKNGAEINEFLYRIYIEGASETLEFYREKAKKGGSIYTIPFRTKHKLTPEARAREEANHNAATKKQSYDVAVDAVSNMITCRKVMKLKPEKGKHFWDAAKVGRAYDQDVKQVVPRFVDSMPREKLGQLMLADHDGAALETSLRKYIVQLNEPPKNLPDSFTPTAKERIEALQEKIRAKETSLDQKRMYAMEIIATRESVGAKRGGENLDKKPDYSGIQERTEQIRKNMAVAFGDAQNIDKYLLSYATSGHGGKMMENYRKSFIRGVCLQNAQGNLPPDLSDLDMPPAKLRIETLQQQLRNSGNKDGRDSVTFYLAAILAARENVNAQRGGKGLENRLHDSRALQARTNELAKQLSLLDNKDLDKLRTLAISGHGGKMKNTFDSPVYQDKIESKIQDNKNKQAVEEQKLDDERAVKDLREHEGDNRKFLDALRRYKTMDDDEQKFAEQYVRDHPLTRNEAEQIAKENRLTLNIPSYRPKLPEQEKISGQDKQTNRTQEQQSIQL